MLNKKDSSFLQNENIDAILWMAYEYHFLGKEQWSHLPILWNSHWFWFLDIGDTISNVAEAWFALQRLIPLLREIPRECALNPLLGEPAVSFSSKVQANGITGTIYLVPV